MKNKDYWGDPRYFKLWERMETLGIKDVSSPRQEKNGTIVWRLPIKNTYSYRGEFIEVASYEAGYVRVLNTCTSPYYINKPEFMGFCGASGYYASKKPKLIPIEIERLEYLISYCLKNMYIKLANERSSDAYVLKSQSQYTINNLLETNRTLTAHNEHLECEVTNLRKELEKEYRIWDVMNDEIIQLKRDIAITEANTELFREVHLSAYNKMIKIKEIIGC